MNAQDLRNLKNGMFATYDKMDDVLEYGKKLFPNSVPYATTLIMVAMNTMLEGLAQQMGNDEVADPPLEAVLSWAEGVLSSEHPDRVTNLESAVAIAVEEAYKKNLPGHYPDRELSHDEAEATYCKTEKEARNGCRVGDPHDAFNAKVKDFPTLIYCFNEIDGDDGIIGRLDEEAQVPDKFYNDMKRAEEMLKSLENKSIGDVILLQSGEGHEATNIERTKRIDSEMMDPSAIGEEALHSVAVPANDVGKWILRYAGYSEQEIQMVDDLFASYFQGELADHICKVD